MENPAVGRGGNCEAIIEISVMGWSGGQYGSRVTMNVLVWLAVQVTGDAAGDDDGYGRWAMGDR